MSSTNQFFEKRKFPRYPADNKYTLILKGVQHQGIIGNISLGGAYLRTVSPYITDSGLFQDCKIIMSLPDTELSLPCSISFIAAEHSKLGHGIGIAFADIDEKPLSVLTHFIEDIQKPI